MLLMPKDGNNARGHRWVVVEKEGKARKLVSPIKTSVHCCP